MDDMSVEFANGIKSAMRDRGMSYVEMADAIGFPEKKVSGWLRNPKSMPLAVCSTMALAVGMELRMRMEECCHG